MEHLAACSTIITGLFCWGGLTDFIILFHLLRRNPFFFYCTGERSRELVEQSGVQSEGGSNAHAVFTGFIQRPPRDTTHKWETHCPFKTTQGPRTAYEWCIKWLFWNVIIIIITGCTLGLHSNHHHGYADMNRKHAGCCLHTSSWYPQCSVDIGSLISLDTQSWSWSRSWIC